MVQGRETTRRGVHDNDGQEGEGTRAAGAWRVYLYKMRCGGHMEGTEQLACMEDLLPGLCQLLVPPLGAAVRRPAAPLTSSPGTMTPDVYA